MALQSVFGADTYGVVNKVMPLFDSTWHQATCVERMSTILSTYSVGAAAAGATAFGLQWVPHPAAQLTAKGLQGGLLAASPMVGVTANTYLKQCNKAEPGNAH